MDSDQHSYDSYTHTCRGGDTGNGEHSGVSAMLAYGYTVSSSSVVGFRALVMIIYESIVVMHAYP